MADDSSSSNEARIVPAADLRQNQRRPIEHIAVRRVIEADQIGIDMQNEPDSSVAQRPPAKLSWKNLTVTPAGKEKILLDKVEGFAQGQFVAILGPSGSGKSTLLNSLALRWTGIDVKGELLINDKPYTTTTFKKIASYVCQDDVLFPDFTVIETLTYAAELRLPWATKALRQKRIETAIRSLNLDACRNTLVGNDHIRGISGGERKRLAIAVEMLTNPHILFLDEPTSGLDSPTALALIQLLKALVVNRNCTVVCTIHQPQSKIFSLFESLIIMSKGRILVQDTPKLIMKYYKQAGHPVTKYTNPADHLLDVIAWNSPETKVEAAKTEESLQKIIQISRAKAKMKGVKGKDRERIRIRGNNNRSSDSNPSDDPEEANAPENTTQADLIPTDENEGNACTLWLHQFRVLFKRSFNREIHSYSKMLISLILTIVISLLIGFAFYRIGDTQSSVVRRLPALFFCAIHQGIFGALVLINSFPSERAIVLRERASGAYHISAYFFAKMGVDWILNLYPPIIYSIITYWLIGLQASGSKFFIFMVINIVSNMAASSLALAISTLTRNTSLSVIILPMCFEVARLFGGFLLAPANIPNYFVWIDFFSYIKYSYVGFAVNELSGLTLRCTDQQLVVNGTSTYCPITTGEQTMKALGLDQFSVGYCIGMLVAYLVVFRAISFMGLKWIKVSSVTN